MRNRVNQLFVLNLQVKRPVLASIARTKGKQNILLTTTEEYNTDFLVKYKEIWQNYFTFCRYLLISDGPREVAYVSIM